MRSRSIVAKAILLLTAGLLLLSSLACKKKEIPGLQAYANLIMTGNEEKYERLLPSEMLMTLGIDPLDCKEAVRYKRIGYANEFLLIEVKDHSRTAELTATANRNLYRLDNAENAKVESLENEGFIFVYVSMGGTGFGQARAYFYSFY